MAIRKIGFNGLAHMVAREYERKGISTRTAELWGRETAAKVAREKRRKL